MDRKDPLKDSFRQIALDDKENPYLVRGCIANAIFSTIVHVFRHPASQLYREEIPPIFLNSRLCKVFSTFLILERNQDSQSRREITDT